MCFDSEGLGAGVGVQDVVELTVSKYFCVL